MVLCKQIIVKYLQKLNTWYSAIGRFWKLYIIIEGIPIKQETSTNFRGILIDQKLTWREYVLWCKTESRPH